MSIFGIDLGTSFTKVSRWDGKQCEVVNVTGGGIAMIGGEKNLVSALYRDADGTFVVGQAAYNLRKGNPAGYVSEFKRRFGDDTPFVLSGKRYTTDALYTEMFKYIQKQLAQKGEKMEQVVLTCPASYTPKKRNLLQAAANAAGLWQVDIIDEPSAAARCYAQSHTVSMNERILVFDLGGGTFDATLIQKTADDYKHLAAPVGLADCGGADFDDMIFDDLVKKVRAAAGEDAERAIKNTSFLLQLKETAILIKHQLSQTDRYTESITVGFDSIQYTLTRAGFEQMIQPYIERAIGLCDTLITRAELNANDIHRILPVGGGCAIPYVREMLAKHYPIAEIAVTQEPGLLVSMGAAMTEKEMVGILSKPSKVKQNPEKFPRTHIKKEEPENSITQFERGTAYYLGQGVIQDYAKAVKYFRMAAERGQINAQYNLGICYMDGQGVIQDYEEAAKWFGMAAEQGHANAQLKLRICTNSHGIVQYNAFGKRVNANSKYLEGMQFYFGNGVPKDMVKAFEQFKEAAEEGYMDAQYMLGLCYWSGNGTQVDRPEAIQWYKKAAQQGHGTAAHQLNKHLGMPITAYTAKTNRIDQLSRTIPTTDAELFQEGVDFYNGTNSHPLNLNLAAEIFSKAAEHNHTRSQYMLGKCYEKGYGVSRDKERAVTWYHCAAEQGDIDAQCALGRCCEDQNDAKKWLEQAAALGSAEAQIRLRYL